MPKVTFPHMGTMAIGVKGLLRELGVETIVPPPITKRTLELGCRHSPEFACLPLKINLGNFIEAAELGADTILMAGGMGPCRFGYYAQVQREILKDLGYDLEMVVLEPPEKHISQFVQRLRRITGNQPLWRVMKALRLAWHKLAALDRLERLVATLRARAYQPEEVEKAWRQVQVCLDQARTLAEIKQAVTHSQQLLYSLPVDWAKKVVRIGLTGEIYCLLEPFANLEIERRLGALGVEVERSLYLSHWINEHLFRGLIPGIPNSHQACQAASPYLNHFVGGHGQVTIGHAVLWAQKGFDGLIQVAPLTCMPEIVAQSILPQVSNELGIPAMTLYFDQHTGEAGLQTRLEAFVDLLVRQKEVNRRNESISRY
ncbi:MAG: CoA protein activase [Bacillota bacterium]